MLQVMPAQYLSTSYVANARTDHSAFVSIVCIVSCVSRALVRRLFPWQDLFNMISYKHHITKMSILIRKVFVQEAY